MAALSPAATSPAATSANTRASRASRASRESQIDRAWALHCEGHKSPAIGERLGVAERTVRSWIARVTKELAANRDSTRAERLAVAVDCHLAVAAAAWDAFHRAEDLDRAALDDYRAALAERRPPARAPEPEWPRPEDFGLDPDTLDPAVKEEARRIMASAAQATPPPPPQPKLATLGARYLALALQAQRAVARLEGLHVYVPEPDKHKPGHILLAPPDHMVIPDEDVEAWRAFRRHYYDNGGVPVRPEALCDAVERMADDLARGTLDPAHVPTDEANPSEIAAESADPGADGADTPEFGDFAPSSAEMAGDAHSASPDPLEKSAESARSATSSAHERAAAAAARLTPGPHPKKRFPADIDFPYLIPFEESHEVLREIEKRQQDDLLRTGPDPMDTPFDPDRSYP